MEVAHTDLTEVTGVVLVDVGTVVVLTTGHTTTTGALAVLADTTVTGGHMAAAVKRQMLVMGGWEDMRWPAMLDFRISRPNVRGKDRRSRLTASGSARNG